HVAVVVVEVGRELLGRSRRARRVSGEVVGLERGVVVRRDPAVTAELVVEINGATAAHGLESRTSLGYDDVGLADGGPGIQAHPGRRTDGGDLDARTLPRVDERAAPLAVEVVAEDQGATWSQRQWADLVEAVRLDG